jgi:hypothetical protein
MAKQTAPKPDTATPDAAAAAAAPAGDQKDGTAVAAAGTDPTPPETGNEGTATAGAGEPVPASAASEDQPVGLIIEATGPVIIVKGPAKGRWRIGRHFTPEVTEIPAADLTEEQIEALVADPELMVKSVP